MTEFTEMISLNQHGIYKILDDIKDHIFLSAEYNARIIDPEDYVSLLTTGNRYGHYYLYLK